MEHQLMLKKETDNPLYDLICAKNIIFCGFRRSGNFQFSHFKPSCKNIFVVLGLVI